MNYIIWKGIDSRDIKGLLISELAPISNPDMKTKITEIDGKDGDIIEELGYKSYDKKISIGLTRDYDIDEIIKYFTGEGILINSNEPDKYYKAKIVKGVDYQRLVRFRTASVEFHIQPYKYLVDEPPFILNITNETSLKVANQGLEESKPIMKLSGTGIVTIAIDGIDAFTIEFNNEEYIIIDSEEQEAYQGDILKNRQMTGDFPILKSGVSTISWTGTLTRIEIYPQSRWL